jgi:hypothetical protein
VLKLRFFLRNPIGDGMVRRPMKKHPIDTKWFLNRIEDMGESIHALAPRMTGRNKKLDYSSLYRVLHGERAMSLQEAVEIAELLKTPLETVARKALGK